MNVGMISFTCVNVHVSIALPVKYCDVERSGNEGALGFYQV